MKRYGIVVAIAGLLLFSNKAWADEQTKNNGHLDGGHGTTQVQKPPAKQQEVNIPEMKMEDVNPNNMTPEEHKNMNMDGNSDSHGTNGSMQVVESPPNIVVLSTFGGIMLAFILYGAWNKWLRKKERAHA
jgi:hypothetical protein